MRIDRIQIRDFRGFENLKMDFRSGINVLVGDNASGKTSVLMACRQVLNAFFSGFSDENTSWLGLDDDDFRQVVRNGAILPDLPVRIAFSCTAEGLPPGQVFEVVKKSRRKGRILISPLAGYRDYSRHLASGTYAGSGERLRPLPLFAFFSTEGIHKGSKVPVSKFKEYNHKPSFGYVECLNSRGLLPHWLSRLLVLEENGDATHEVAIVCSAVRRVLGDDGCGIIADVSVRPNRGKVFCMLKDGREVEAGLLSDGHRRLLGIVVDLAFRCALLNRTAPGFGDETCLHTKGVVLMDEVDMHLHPGLQLRALPSLKAAFPGLQFIATTHAPMVMTAIEDNAENAVQYLKYDSVGQAYTASRVFTFGLDASSVNRLVLDMPARNAEVEQQLANLFRLIDAGRELEARALLDSMRDRFGDTLPELARAGAMLDFYMAGEDE